MTQSTVAMPHYAAAPVIGGVEAVFQAYADTGLFLQLTADDMEDVPIPNIPYTFGIFKRTQALGDLEALQKHGRQMGRVHLGSDTNQGLAALKEDLKPALQPEQVMS